MLCYHISRYKVMTSHLVAGVAKHLHKILRLSVLQSLQFFITSLPVKLQLSFTLLQFGLPLHGQCQIFLVPVS